jgi:hypothetical protein
VQAPGRRTSADTPLRNGRARRMPTGERAGILLMAATRVPNWSQVPE